MSLDLHHLRAALDTTIVAVHPLSGGDVAESFRVELGDGSTVFAKTHTNPPPLFFSTEARSLSWLRESEALPVPEVLAVSDDPPLLALEWIDESPAARPDEAAFGRGLARLHAHEAASFGRLDRRTTGSRGLPNEPCDNWAEFYRTQRLVPLARLAADTGALPPTTITDLEHVAARLADLGGPAEPAARLHGDLWAGNRVVDRSGRSWLIDPAAHGGHREFDLAMMRLFGGFGPACFAAYDEVAPLADGWADRVVLHQLAPLVVHAIKFGGHYVAACQDAIAGYC